jgi:FkbM family methyltransferase
MVECVCAGWFERLVVGHMRSRDHPGKLRMCRWMLRTRNGDTLEMRLGGATRIRVPFEDYIGHAMLMAGHYEPETLTLADRLTRDGGVFVDVGANFGLFSIFLARKPEVTVLAIEPDPLNFLRLEENVRRANPEQCFLVHGLIGDQRDILPVAHPVSHNRGTVKVADSGSHGNSISHFGLSAPLDELLVHFGLDQVELLKIDVEGFERQVLAGCSFDTSRRPKNVILEFSDQGLRFDPAWGRRELASFFTERGYEFLNVLGEHGEGAVALPEHNAWFRDTRS